MVVGAPLLLLQLPGTLLTTEFFSWIQAIVARKSCRPFVLEGHSVVGRATMELLPQHCDPALDWSWKLGHLAVSFAKILLYQDAS